MAQKYRQYVVFLKDNGTHKVTRHRVKAVDRDLAARTFSDRGLHALGAEDFWLHVVKRLGLVTGILLALTGTIYLSVEVVRVISFYFF